MTLSLKVSRAINAELVLIHPSLVGWKFDLRCMVTDKTAPLPSRWVPLLSYAAMNRLYKAFYSL